MVSISIVNWNGIKYLPHCLGSIYKQDYIGELEIIIIDNHSTDGSLEYLEKNQNSILLLKNRLNRGFSYAHNQAIRASKGKYILFLNFDVFLEQNFISEMVRLMDSDQSIGMASSKLYKQIDGEKTKLIDSTGITMKYCLMHPRGQMEEDKGQYDSPEYFKVFGVCGAAAFCRRKALDDIVCFDEYFDEDFVNYVEDVDLSWRVQLRGWKCIYNPKAVAYHERGATRKDNHKMQKEYLIYGFRNRYCSMIKNITLECWKKNKFKIIGIELLFLLSPNLPIGWKALYLALKMIKKMLAKRKIIQKRKKITEEGINYFLCYNSLSLRKIIE